MLLPGVTMQKPFHLGDGAHGSHGGSLSLGRGTQVDRLHMVVDLENLCGGSELVARGAEAAYRAISNVVRLDKAQIVVAVGVNAWRQSPQLGFMWPGARFLVGRGVDGADIRLIEDLVEEPQALRSARVVIASGDGRFEDAALHLRAHGVYTIAVARSGCLSRRLGDAVDEIRYLPMASA